MGRADSGTTAVTNVTRPGKHALAGYAQDSLESHAPSSLSIMRGCATISKPI